eukprot:TRINITY_DN2494_c0_g1_i3.p1 TRINITY_DN2494_c0_g1~~TRINITY_DN2494_c0_g1_i3.p1  ORF type:complete len:113 (+),score=34.08 TRINITY_DN2494_c0_g1_i3:14-352(+)
MVAGKGFQKKLSMKDKKFILKTEFMDVILSWANNMENKKALDKVPEIFPKMKTYMNMWADYSIAEAQDTILSCLYSDEVKEIRCQYRKMRVNKKGRYILEAGINPVDEKDIS